MTLPIPDINSDFYCPYCDCRRSVDELIRFEYLTDKSIVLQCISEDCKRRFLVDLSLTYMTKISKIGGG